MAIVRRSLVVALALITAVCGAEDDPRPAAAPAASKSVARSSASLGLHGAAALLEMSERKGTAVDR